MNYIAGTGIDNSTLKARLIWWWSQLYRKRGRKIQRNGKLSSPLSLKTGCNLNFRLTPSPFAICRSSSTVLAPPELQLTPLPVSAAGHRLQLVAHPPNSQQARLRSGASAHWTPAFWSSVLHFDEGFMPNLMEGVHVGGVRPWISRCGFRFEKFNNLGFSNRIRA